MGFRENAGLVKGRKWFWKTGHESSEKAISPSQRESIHTRLHPPAESLEKKLKKAISYNYMIMLHAGRMKPYPPPLDKTSLKLKV